MQNDSPEMAFLSYAPLWMKTAVVSMISVFQLGVGIAYANTPGMPETGGYRLDAITFVALASPFVTISIGCMGILSKFWSTKMKMDHESQHDKREQEIEARQKAIEIRMDLLDRGVPCEVPNCPIYEIAAGKLAWDTLPPLRKPNTFPLGDKPTPADAKPHEDTVDLA
jgi:hypothetical protein